MQREVVEAALRLVEHPQDQPVIESLPQEWPSDWRAMARKLKDDRTPRYDTPQYDVRP
ncbi:MAG: hypothetical protein HOM37_09840 [Acidimicrobiaceae bacterium]|nr:hypothetical protein [Acidimicrobiaceae bacterium]